MPENVELFGIFAISIMVISYALESRSRIFIAIFALGCLWRLIMLGLLAHTRSWSLKGYGRSLPFGGG